ncbi:MAG TPA: phosphatase PAP2 family protein [Verrucomicrobiae bacterium]|nr:phosphatase PAP2 family protein [Verrucomicrobiae bacterium]
MSDESKDSKKPVKRFILSPMRLIEWIDSNPSETFRRVCHTLLAAAIIFATSRIYVNWHYVSDALAGSSESIKNLLASKIPFWGSLLTGLLSFGIAWFSHRTAKKHEVELKHELDKTVDKSVRSYHQQMETMMKLASSGITVRPEFLTAPTPPGGFWFIATVNNKGNETVTVLGVFLYANTAEPIGLEPRHPLKQLHVGASIPFQRLFNEPPPIKMFEQDGRKYGKGYVQLAGDLDSKINFEFDLVPDAAWKPIEPQKKADPKPFFTIGPERIQEEVAQVVNDNVGHKCSACGFFFLMKNPKLIAPGPLGKKYVKCPNKRCGHTDELK